MQDIEIIICSESGYLESLSKLLISSIRTFGGAYKDVPIYSYQPRKYFKISRETIRWFEDHNVTYVDVPLNKSYTNYPLANKPLACAYHEQKSTAQTLIFLDSDIFFLGEPVLFDLPSEYDASLRPLDLSTLSGARSFDHPNGQYWKELYSLLNIQSERRVVSTVDNQNILEYYNSGHVIAKTGNNLFQHSEENFHKTMQAGLLLPNGHFYVEQSVLSATITQLELKVLPTPKQYNFPIHLMDDLKNPDYKIESANELISVHYHKLFQNKAGDNPVEGCIAQHPNGLQINTWLVEFGIPQLSSAQNSVGKKLMKKWNELRSKF